MCACAHIEFCEDASDDTRTCSMPRCLSTDTSVAPHGHHRLLRETGGASGNWTTVQNQDDTMGKACKGDSCKLKGTTTSLDDCQAACEAVEGCVGELCPCPRTLATTVAHIVLLYNPRCQFCHELVLSRLVRSSTVLHLCRDLHVIRSIVRTHAHCSRAPNRATLDHHQSRRFCC